MDIVDAHVHLWTDDPVRYPEQASRPEYMQQRCFEPADYWPLATSCGVRRAVLIQTENYGDDLSYAMDVAAGDARLRVIGMINLASPPSPAVLAEHRAAGVVGYRLLMRDNAELHRLEAAAVEQFLDACASLGSIIAPLASPTGFGAIHVMCVRRPGLRVVIDHMGLVQPTAATYPRDLAALCDLAKHPRVHVKLSGFWALGSGLPHDDLLPQMNALRDAFGVERLMWASDDPYQRWCSAYQAGVSLIADRFARSTDEASRMLATNAERLYF